MKRALVIPLILALAVGPAEAALAHHRCHPDPRDAATSAGPGCASSTAAADRGATSWS